MRAQTVIIQCFAINAKFLATELLVLFLISSAALTVTVASQKEAIIASESPLKIQQHPPTFFDEVKPAYNEFLYFGIHMILPIGQALAHAQKAISFASHIPFLPVDVQAMVAPSKFQNNTIKITKLDPKLVWKTAMARMIRLKREALRGKITELNDIVNIHATPPQDFINAINLHHSTAHHATSAQFSKRSIDLNLDLTSAVSAFFSGVSSIFHFRAINEVSAAVNNLRVKQVHLESFTKQFAHKVEDLLVLMNAKEKEDVHTLETVLTIFLVLDEAEEFLDVILAAITPLLQGTIPSCMVTPANLIELFDTVKEEAAKKGLKIALANANEILTLSPFTFQRGDNYELLLSVPVVDQEKQFTMYKLVNLPDLKNGVPTVWNLPELFFGLRPTLYPQNADYISIEAGKINEVCQEYFSMYLCKIPTATKPSCVSDLFHNRSTHCTTSSPLFTPILQPMTKIHLFFFQQKTDAMIHCGKKFARVIVHGLIQIQDRPGCQLVTNEFSYTFLGTDPEEIFDQPPIKIVDSLIMPNVSEHQQDQIDKNLKDLSEDLTDFEESIVDSPPVPVYTVMDYINLAMTILALLLGIGLVVFFVYRCRGILAATATHDPAPADEENQAAPAQAPGSAAPP